MPENESRSSDEWAIIIAAKITEVEAAIASAKNAAPETIRKSASELARAIDHTLLKPDASTEQIDKLCDQAIAHDFKSCCVNGTHIARVAQRLQGHASIPCAVVGFPLGAVKSSVKAFETAEAVADGAQEIDMVINIGALKSRDYCLVFNDVRAVVSAAAARPVKAIIETALLTDGEKIAASFIAAEAGADFVKTCTGFSGGGATAGDVALMRQTVAYKGGIQVKASAGIRSLEQCLEMIRAGATRIGTSSGVAILQGTFVRPDAY